MALRVIRCLPGLVAPSLHETLDQQGSAMRGNSAAEEWWAWLDRVVRHGYTVAADELLRELTECVLPDLLSVKITLQCVQCR